LPEAGAFRFLRPDGGFIVQGLYLSGMVNFINVHSLPRQLRLASACYNSVNSIGRTSIIYDNFFAAWGIKRLESPKNLAELAIMGCRSYAHYYRSYKGYEEK
jgi:hypothetical protein